MDWWNDKKFKLLVKDLKKASGRDWKDRLNLLVEYVSRPNMPKGFGVAEPVEAIGPIESGVSKEVRPKKRVPAKRKKKTAKTKPLVSRKKKAGEAKTLFVRDGIEIPETPVDVGKKEAKQRREEEARKIVAERLPRLLRGEIKSFSFPLVGGVVRRELQKQCGGFHMDIINSTEGERFFVTSDPLALAPTLRR